MKDKSKEKTKVCVQCRKRKPIRFFEATEAAKKVYPGIEKFCALCYSCP